MTKTKGTDIKAFEGWENAVQPDIASLTQLSQISLNALKYRRSATLYVDCWTDMNDFPRGLGYKQIQRNCNSHKKLQDAPMFVYLPCPLLCILIYLMLVRLLMLEKERWKTVTPPLLHFHVLSTISSLANFSGLCT